MKIFGKLVRDRIPEIIRENGEEASIKILDDEEYEKELNKKLLEEVKEYLESGEVEELADVEEVLRALLDIKGVTYEEFNKMRETKSEKRGAFKDKIFLESTN